MKIILFFLISLTTNFSCKKKNTTPDLIELPVITNTNFAKGADVSWLTQQESSAIKFYNNSGTETEGMALLKSIGINTIRLRVWVNPINNYNNTADVLVKALRAKNLGLRIMIDFHYSDTWADPGSQTKPAAWASQDITTLKTSLYNHTISVLNVLKSNGITPEWVQVGNETNNGMLWPEGKASTNMNNFAQLINSGYDAVKSVFATAKVIVHVSNGYDNNLFRWLFDGLQTNGAKYDVIGMSLYPNQTNWATLNSQCLTNMNDMIARYNKEVMIVEVGMGWVYSSECNAFLNDLINKTKTIANNKGLGVLYWEPQAYNNWQGYSLGCFDNSGKPTIGLNAFN
jgi:arabinogalactan endo-1,4-beta-galactosidase